MTELTPLPNVINDDSIPENFLGGRPFTLNNLDDLYEDVKKSCRNGSLKEEKITQFLVLSNILLRDLCHLEQIPFSNYLRPRD